MKVKLSVELKENVASFLEHHPPQQFSADLRRLLLDFMASQINIGFHIEFNRLLCSLNDLFDLLDLAETEIKKQTAVLSKDKGNRFPKDRGRKRKKPRK